MKCTAQEVAETVAVRFLENEALVVEVAMLQKMNASNVDGLCIEPVIPNCLWWSWWTHRDMFDSKEAYISPDEYSSDNFGKMFKKLKGETPTLHGEIGSDERWSHETPVVDDVKPNDEDGDNDKGNSSQILRNCGNTRVDEDVKREENKGKGVKRNVHTLDDNLSRTVTKSKKQK
ncbi:hypothetical protein Bca52824_011133 [Brassica carinata]|uniref:Uncharacterized protein n=1 Tax=Brassica carinata TaxID=52824 RepID=A0A8X8BAT8_BRACI|nr:hypothetical protein Bca52824_011133 [Brassica carinata]